MNRIIVSRMQTLLTILTLIVVSSSSYGVAAQGAGPEMLDPHLRVRPVVTGLVTPTSLAFLSPNELLVLEKNTGKVQDVDVASGTVDHTALDLAVNFSSERGLLGITLDPDFASNHFVYLYWTCQAPHPSDVFYTRYRRYLSRAFAR